MHSLIHLAVRWLADLRHEGASTFSWEAVKTNLGAGPYQAGIGGALAAVIVPRVRAKLKAEAEKIRAVEQAERAALKMRLDHIITHHPSIPPLPEGTP